MIEDDFFDKRVKFPTLVPLFGGVKRFHTFANLEELFAAFEACESAVV